MSKQVHTNKNIFDIKTCFFSHYFLFQRLYITLIITTDRFGEKENNFTRFKVEECNEPSCEALIFPYGVVLFNIFSTICI